MYVFKVLKVEEKISKLTVKLFLPTKVKERSVE